MSSSLILSTAYLFALPPAALRSRFVEQSHLSLETRFGYRTAWQQTHATARPVVWNKPGGLEQALIPGWYSVQGHGYNLLPGTALI